QPSPPLRASAGYRILPGAASPNIRLPHLLACERSAGRPRGTKRPAERDLIRAFPPHPEWLIPVLSAPSTPANHRASPAETETERNLDKHRSIVRRDL